MTRLKAIITENFKLRRLPASFIWLWVACIAFLLVYFIIKAKAYFWIELWFLIEMIILSAFTRTIGWKRLAAVFFQGIVLSGTVTFILYKLLTISGADVNSAAINGWVIGFAEELFKLLPVGIAVYFIYKKRKMLCNPSDFLILSVMSGSGFSMLEKTFWGDVSFPFTYGPHIGKLYFFPDALGIYVDGRILGYVGHAAATGLVGMAAGIAFYLKKKYKKNWVWALPAFAYLWVSVEHALVNSYYEEGVRALLKIGGGLATPYIFILFLAAVLFIDIRSLLSWLKNKPLAKKILKSRKIFFFRTLHVFNFLAYTDRAR